MNAGTLREAGDLVRFLAHERFDNGDDCTRLYQLAHELHDGASDLETLARSLAPKGSGHRLELAGGRFALVPQEGPPTV